jgi:hypothetical protein
MTDVRTQQTFSSGKAGRGNRLGSLDFAAFLLMAPVIKVAVEHGNLFTLYQVQTQDLPILLALPPMLMILQRWAPAWTLPARAPGRRVLLVAGLALALLLGWGAHALLYDFPLSRDEHMVAFDMAVYGKGRLAAPLAPQWRGYAEALVPAFLLNASEPDGLVSAYLPVNALLRLGFSQIADPVFLNPLLALAGGIALHDIARRQFIGEPRAVWVTLIVYALSSQMLVNAMTVYSMTGHMALNLIWLAAFLRGGRRGHAIAICTGALATGLHQVAFHSLFAAPFVLWRWRQGEWRTALLFGVAYVVIIGGWILFPLLAGIHGAVQGPNESRFFDRVVPLLLHRDPLTVSWMMLNLVRFVAWQHLALLPLFVAAFRAASRDRGGAVPMLAGIILTTTFVGFVLPFQGHGWGYRYLQPCLGSFALLAGIGYQQLRDEAPARTDGVVIVLTLATLLGSVPLLIGQARAFTRPHVLLDRHIAAQKTDFVLVDTEPRTPTIDGRWAVNAVDEVRNDPDLTNRPLRFSSRALDGPMVAELCRRGTVSSVDWHDMHRLGFGANVIGSGRRFDDLVGVLRAGGCLR